MVTRELLGCSVTAYWSKSSIFVIKIVSVINSSSDSTLQLNKAHNMIIHVCSTNGVVELWTNKYFRLRIQILMLPIGNIIK